MKYEPVLPEDFDGFFYFTNDSDEDFTTKWDGNEYTYPAHTTSRMVIPNRTALEIQQIRKKFAKEWADREYQKSEPFQRLMKQEKNPDGTPRLNSFHQAGSYGLDQLTPYIQQCLKPLPEGKAKVATVVKPKLEESLHRDEEGDLVTQAVDKGISLKDKFAKK